MPNPKVRVEISRSPKAILDLAAGIYKKHTDDGAASPLNNLEDNNWTDNGAKIQEAQNLQTEIDAIEKGLESLYRQRDLLIAPILETIQSSRDLLLGIYAKNPKKLGDWTFTVNDTPKTTKAKAAAVK